MAKHLKQPTPWMTLGVTKSQYSWLLQNEQRLQRKASRKSLLEFTKQIFLARKGHDWLLNWHHEAICDALERVERGECKRLIINIPPRYSKTEIAVINFIAWTLGNHPDSEFIHASYSARLAANNSYMARSIVESEAYRAIFPDMQLAGDSKARDDWRTTSGGIVYATGARGTITGFGAGKMRPGFGGAIIIDDPHKADEATSDTMRANVIDWYQNTIQSRTNDEATPVIVIMQRLHENDLAGWLLGGGTGEAWEHLCIPALNEADEALWPAKHTREALRTLEQASPYVFAGQYMQRPSPLSGGMFRPEQMPIIDAVPADVVKWCRGWDLASIVDGDWTAGARLGRLKDGRFVLSGMARFRYGPDERDAAIKNTAEMDGRGTVISLPQDPGQAGKSQVIYLTRQLAGFNVKSSPESGDKVTRAEAFAAQVNVGNVLMVRGDWNADFISELRMFPNGKYDDQVDACSRAFAEVMIPRRSFFG